VKHHIAATPGLNPATLYTLWAGGNDFNDGQMPRDEVVPRAIANIEECIRLLSGVGARSILVITYPNAGCTPLARMLGTAELWHRLSRELATGIITLVMKLRGQVAATLILGDVFKLHEAVIDYPEECGFANITDPCLSPTTGQVVGDPSETLYWDDAHFTTAFHALVADWLSDAIGEGLG
jgi:phospholipase/lecithinase/hemolysin